MRKKCLLFNEEIF